MPTIPDEHWKLILEVTSEKACDLIHYIEDDVLNRPKDSAYNEVRCLLFTIRELAKRIKPLATLSATLEPAPLASATLEPAPLASAPPSAPSSPKGKPRKGVIQCYRCFGFNHIASTCKKPQICGYCKAEGHIGSTCQVQQQRIQPPSCINCQGSHQAWALGCPARLQLQYPQPQHPQPQQKSTPPRPQTHTQTRTYAEVTTGQQPQKQQQQQQFQLQPKHQPHWY